MRIHQRFSGLLAAILPATVLIAALSGCHNPGSCVVGPTIGPLVRIAVTPDPATMVVNTTQQFVATGYDANNNVVVITPTPTWSVVAGGGTINTGSGLFTAGGVTGTFSNTIRATSGALSDLATVNVTAAPPADILGSAGTFGILAGSAVTSTGPSVIAGDVGVSPGSAITGFPPGTLTGTRHQADPIAATAQSNLTTAYNDLEGRACGTVLTGQNLGGMTLAPGVYCFSTSAQLTGALAFNGQGNSNAVFVIQIGSTLTTASNASVNLIGGAQAKNVYWQVGSSATIGSGSSIQGNVIALTSITLNTGASLFGRALARNGAISLDTGVITVPSP